MNKTSHTVTRWSIRPAGSPTHCFYCQAALGQQHNIGCVCREKSWMVRFTVDIVVESAEDSDIGDIEFRYNDGSWCADNLVEMLEDLGKRTKRGCLCGHVKAEVLREATEDDHARQGFEFSEPE